MTPTEQSREGRAAAPALSAAARLGSGAIPAALGSRQPVTVGGRSGGGGLHTYLRWAWSEPTVRQDGRAAREIRRDRPAKGLVKGIKG